MKSEVDYRYNKSLKLLKYELTKEELISLILFFKSNRVLIYSEIDNDKFNYNTTDIESFISELRSSKSLINLNFLLCDEDSCIEFEYSTLKVIKNNCRIKIHSNTISSLDLLEAVTINELKKYKNDVRTLVFKVISIFLSVSIFISMFLQFFTVDNLNSEFKFNSSFFFDAITVAIIPLLLGMSLYHSAVPTLRLKNNEKLNGIKTYIKTDYRSIIKDVIIAIIFW